MSVNIKKVLELMNVENVDELSEILINGTELNQEAVDTILKASQGYARPFVESELNGKQAEERKTWKGKYFKESALKVNKIFGAVLTNAEIDEILKDPANEGQTYDAVIAAIKEKATESMTPKELSEYKKMIDTQSIKLAEYEEKMQGLEAEYEKKFEDKLNQTKLDAALDNELMALLPKLTSISPQAASKLIKNLIGDKAVVKLGSDGKLSLYDPSNPETPLKKSGTELYKFNDLITDIANEAELPSIKSGGSSGGNQAPPPPTDDKKNNSNPAAKSAQGLADAVAALG